MFFNKKDKDKEELSIKPEDLRDMGAVSFTVEDVQRVQNQKGSPNAKAYEYMVEAMSVSAKYMGQKTIDKETRLDDVYPTSLEETMKMDELLDKSERAVQDENDEEYNKMITELRGIVGWSRRRHFNFSWLIILGSLFTIFFMVHHFGGMRSKLHRYEYYMNKVKAWSLDPDSITLDMANDTLSRYYYGDVAYDKPIYYKAFRLKTDAEWLRDYEESVRDNRYSMDTAQSRSDKKYFKKEYEKAEKRVKFYTKLLDEEQNEWDFKDFQKDALKRLKASYRETMKTAIGFWFMQFLFLMLIPLYIFANHSWGYVITKYREENSKLEEIKMWTFVLAAGMIGAAASIKLLPGKWVTVLYNNGYSETRYEDNPANTGKYTLKAVLVALALLAIIVVSFGILVYSTWVGLKRNYDWKAIYKGAKEKAVDVAGKVNEKVNEYK